MKTWFAVRLLFRSRIDGKEIESPLCEESIRLVQASNEDEALSRAATLGQAEEHEYTNEAGETVSWKFDAVLEVQDLCESELREGMEVFSRLFRDSEATPRSDA